MTAKMLYQITWGLPAFVNFRSRVSAELRKKTPKDWIAEISVLLVAMFIILQLLDALTTSLAVAMGAGSEVGTIVSVSVFHRFGLAGMWLFKAFIVAALLAIERDGMRCLKEYPQDNRAYTIPILLSIFCLILNIQFAGVLWYNL